MPYDASGAARILDTARWAADPAKHEAKAEAAAKELVSAMVALAKANGYAAESDGGSGVIKSPGATSTLVRLSASANGVLLSTERAGIVTDGGPVPLGYYPSEGLWHGKGTDGLVVLASAVVEALGEKP